MASTAAYLGLSCYIVAFVLMLIRNFNVTRAEQQRNDDLIQLVIACVYDKHNPAFFSAVLICISSILTHILFIGFGEGLIFNIFQQGLYASWLLSLFRHFISILDPFQRIVDNRLNETVSYWLHIIIALLCIAMSMLVWAGITPMVFHNANTVNLFFMGQAAFMMCINFGAARLLMQLYICCRRGLQAQIKGKLPLESHPPRVTWLAHVKTTAYGGDVELSKLAPSVDAGCMRSLMLQKIMLERLLGMCMIAFVFNMYKLSWSASLTGCFFRRTCGRHVADNTAETVLGNLSYWLPDFVGFLYWFCFLLNPLSVQLKSSAEKRHTQLSIQRDSHIIQSQGSINLGLSLYERHSGPSIEMNSNPLVSEDRLRSVSTELSPSGRPDSRDLQRLSRKSKQRSVKNLFLPGGDTIGNTTHKSTISSLLKNLSSHSDCRELHLSLTEMVLIDKRVGLPVPSLFAGRDTFVVMSVAGLEAQDPGKKKRTSRVMDRIGDGLRSVSRVSKVLLRGSLFAGDDDCADSPDSFYREMARSDCRINEANPEFIVSFVIPHIDETEETANVRWRFDIYNGTTVDPSFRSELAALEEQVRDVLVCYEHACVVVLTYT